MLNIKKGLLIAVNELRYLLFNTKLIIVPILLILIYSIVVEPLKECCVEMGGKMSFFEPFLALTSSSFVILLLPLVFVAILADFPNVGIPEIPRVIKSNKRTWVFGCILFSAMAILLFLGLVLLATMLMLGKNGAITADFSDTVTKYLSVFPEKNKSVVAELLPANLYNQMYLYEAFRLNIITLFLYLFIFTNIQILATVLNKRILGIVINILIIAIGTLTVSIRLPLMWLFPMAHTVPWIHFEEYLSKPVYPMEYSLIYLITFNMILILLSFVFARNYSVMDNVE